MVSIIVLPDFISTIVTRNLHLFSYISLHYKRYVRILNYWNTSDPTPLQTKNHHLISILDRHTHVCMTTIRLHWRQFRCTVHEYHILSASNH